MVFLFVIVDKNMYFAVENEICEPEKRHLDLEGCGKCICRSHGYGSICEKVKCPRYYKRPVGTYDIIFCI